MPRYFAVAEDKSANASGTAILLVNLGTPDAPTATAVRRYLAEFLTDPRVVEQPRWLWWPILHGLILRFRPARSARNYARIWTAAGSPLRVGTEAIAARLETALAARVAAPVRIRAAMRYGIPALGPVLRELAATGMQRLLVLPLFPQFSATTTAAVLDAVGAEFARWRHPPELRFVNDYHAEPAYIEALAQCVEAHWRERGRGERLLLSFHGIPERYIRAGDPYFAQCGATAARLRERLGLTPEQALLTFQSRIGREPWLRPYTDRTLAQLLARGVKRVDVLCPGFAVDCLETLEEIAITNRERFLAAGGERLDYIPALNAGEGQIALLTGIIRRHAQGWPEFARS